MKIKNGKEEKKEGRKVGRREGMKAVFGESIISECLELAGL